MTCSWLVQLAYSQGGLICAMTRRFPLVIIASVLCAFSTASVIGDGGVSYSHRGPNFEASLTSGVDPMQAGVRGMNPVFVNVNRLTGVASSTSHARIFPRGIFYFCSTSTIN